MSFPRAAVKRFNETESVGPAPGQYNPQGTEKFVGVIKFENCSQRFKSTESVHSDSEGSSKEFLVPAGLPSSASKRKLNFGGSATKKSERRNDHMKTLSGSSMKEKQAQEREIRKLLQQCTEREHDLKNTREEIHRLQGKVAGLLKEKLLLEGQITSAEKSNSSLKKKNDLLVTQVSKDKNSKNIENKLEETQSLLSTCRQQMEKDRLKIANLEADLEAAKSSISALQEANFVLEKFNQEAEKHDNEVSAQITRLQGIADKLRSENGDLQSKLESSQSSLQQLEGNFHDSLQSLVDECMKECREKTQVADDAAAEVQQRIEAANNKIEGLDEVISELRSSRDRLLEENDALQRTVEKLQQDHHEVTTVNERLSVDFEKQTEQLSASKEEISQLLDKISTLQQEYERNSEDQIEETKLMLTERDMLKERLETEREVAAELDGKVQKYEIEAEKLKSQTEAVLSERDNLSTKLDAAEDKAASLKSECECLNEKLKGKESENSDLTRRVDDALQDLKKYKEEVAKAERRESEFEISSSSLKASLESAIAKVAENKEIIDDLRQKAKDSDSQHDAKLNEFTRRILDTQKKLNQRDTELKVSKEELLSVAGKLEELDQIAKERNSAAEREIQRLKEEKEAVEEELSEATTVMQELQLSQQPSNEDATREIAKWKHLFEELQEKVKPFQGQLDAYSAEKSMLLNETSAAHAEMNQLGRKYAELLGHHNQKQKIKHIVKIKEENLTLKQEAYKLRGQVAALQKQVIGNRKPLFDPSKAFQHHKENTDPN